MQLMKLLKIEIKNDSYVRERLLDMKGVSKSNRISNDIDYLPNKIRKRKHKSYFPIYSKIPSFIDWHTLLQLSMIEQVIKYEGNLHPCNT